jgi:hypothetical protein
VNTLETSISKLCDKVVALEADLAAKDQQLARIKAAADADEVDLNTMRDGSKLTRHGLVQSLEYWREEVAAKDAEIERLRTACEAAKYRFAVIRAASAAMSEKTGINCGCEENDEVYNQLTAAMARGTE